jgi:hypothetical protein
VIEADCLNHGSSVAVLFDVTNLHLQSVCSIVRCPLVSPSEESLSGCVFDIIDFSTSVHDMLDTLDLNVGKGAQVVLAVACMAIS